MIDVHPRQAALIAASLDRPLTPEERAEVGAHVIGCAGCRALEQQLRTDAAALAIPMRIPPPRAIQAELERQVAIPPLDPSLVRALRIGVAGALVLIGIVVLAIGLALFQPRSTTPMETTEPEPAGLHLAEGSW